MENASLPRPDSLDTAQETLRLGGRSWLAAALRGWRGRCPNCGERHLFTAYVKMAYACKACGQPFEPFRADDAPAYFTIFAVGHIVVPLMLIVEQRWVPDLWVHAALWLPGTLGLSLFLLPRIKGAVIGLQWGLNMKPGEAH